MAASDIEAAATPRLTPLADIPILRPVDNWLNAPNDDITSRLYAHLQRRQPLSLPLPSQTDTPISAWSQELGNDFLARLTALGQLQQSMPPPAAQQAMAVELKLRSLEDATSSLGLSDNTRTTTSASLRTPESESGSRSLPSQFDAIPSEASYSTSASSSRNPPSLTYSGYTESTAFSANTSLASFILRSTASEPRSGPRSSPSQSTAVPSEVSFPFSISTSSQNPPSLTFSGHTQSSGFSAGTSLASAVSGYPFLEPGDEQLRPARPPRFECSFYFLGCAYASEDVPEWKAHCLSHFHPHEPPKRVTCPLCPVGAYDRTYGSGREAWERRLHHVAMHHAMGYSLATARPDFELITWLKNHKVIQEWEYRDLMTGGGSSVGAEEETVTTTTHNAREERRRRRLR